MADEEFDRLDRLAVLQAWREADDNTTVAEMRARAAQIAELPVCTCGPPGEVSDFYCPVHRGRPRPEPKPTARPSWDQRARYIRALLELAAWAHREADRAQVGDSAQPSGRVWTEFVNARGRYRRGGA